MSLLKKLLLVICLFCFSLLPAQVITGAEKFFLTSMKKVIKGKKIGLVTHHTAVDRNCRTCADLALANARDYQVVALFAPEHGFWGHTPAGKDVYFSKFKGLEVHSLYGTNRKPSDKMLENIDVMIVDLQDIGVRCYTYLSTLLYVMEACSSHNIPVIVLDRPNALNGVTVDGPLLSEDLRSFVGYMNIPICHGMTMGELAEMFNEEYKIGCDLMVIPMDGWKRTMSFAQTGLPWVPTSPHIPEVDTPLYYPITNLLGEMGLVSIGIGYTLPFKLIGAPWFRSESFIQSFRALKLEGIAVHEFHFCPFFGRFKGQVCQGVRFLVTDHTKYKPIQVQYAIWHLLKIGYPTIFENSMSVLRKKRTMFDKCVGQSYVLETLTTDKEVFDILSKKQASMLEAFHFKRMKYLNPTYRLN